MAKDIDVFKIDEENEENEKGYRKRRAREKDDLRRILKVPEGRRFMLRILSETGMFHTPFTLDSAQTSFNCGRQDMGLWLVKELDQVEPMAYSQMLREYYSELKSHKPKEK